MLFESCAQTVERGNVLLYAADFRKLRAAVIINEFDKLVRFLVAIHRNAGNFVLLPLCSVAPMIVKVDSGLAQSFASCDKLFEMIMTGKDTM